MIQHAGHEDLALRGRKLDRDLRLLLIENEERPDEPFILFNLGALYRETNRPADALPLLQAEPGTLAARRLHRAQVACPDRGVPAEVAAAARGPRRMPRRACGMIPTIELLFHEALILRELGDLAAAEATLLDLLTASPSDRLANGDAGLRGYKARHHLAVIYEETGRAAKAEAHWRAAITENPQFTPGWLRLGELFLKQGRWADLEGGRGGPGGLLRRRCHVACPARPRGRRPRSEAAVHRPPAETSRLALHDRQGRRKVARRLPGVGRRPRR